MVNNAGIYSPAEVCELLGISRSTLFRWEAEGKIPPPDRDYLGNRQYTSEHVEALLRVLIERTAERKGPDFAKKQKLGEYLQLHSLYKFINSQDIIGLRELAEHESLASKTIHRLLQEALKYDPADDFFKRIIALVHSKVFPK